MTGYELSDWAVESNAELSRESTKLTQLPLFKPSRLLVFVFVTSLFASAAIACALVKPAENVSGAPVVDVSGTTDVDTSGYYDISELSERPFPPELLDGSDQLDPADVVSAYIKYLSDARLSPREAIELGSASAITDYCSDFTGQVVLNPPISGSVFTWNVRKPDDSAWNVVLLIVNFVDPAVPELLGRGKGSPVSIPWGPATLGTIAVFRSPLCGT